MIPEAFWVLLCVQMAMGTFDMLFHHELTERLAWRPSQRRELVLHALRNLFYAILFVALACLEPRGAWAWALAALLAAELLVTLADFVEEDLTRRLPASERVLHTVLAVNYGAILALLAPVLLDWAASPSGLAVVDRGFWTPFMLAAAATVAPFGLRDALAARRLGRRATRPARDLMPEGGGPRRVLVTGGTGFIGRRLVAALVARGDDVTVLTRVAAHGADLPAPVRLITALDQVPDDARIDAIVNLAGAPIAGGLWTAARRKRLRASRLTVTRDLVALARRLRAKPACLISASAVGVYGVAADDPVDETDRPAGPRGFAQRLCADWEAQASRMATLGVRTIVLRIGLVLDPAGGTLGAMLAPFEFGLGGPLGTGRQWMSWITRDDLVRLIGHCLDQPGLAGPVNAVAPAPARNRDFARALARALRRPCRMAVPDWVPRRGLGALGREIFLASQNVRPTRAIASGFRFHAPDIDTALTSMLRPGTKTS